MGEISEFVTSKQVIHKVSRTFKIVFFTLKAVLLNHEHIQSKIRREKLWLIYEILWFENR